MSNDVYDAWNIYKKNLKDNIEVAINRGKVNKAVLKDMLEILENSKIKIKKGINDNK